MSAGSPPRRTLKLTLAYDGTDFAGWQIQSNARTVQGTLREFLERIAGHPVNLIGSGRTDAGVHALGQVASFETTSKHPCELLLRAINAELPDDVTVLALEDATAGFHAINSASHKRYRYVIRDNGDRDVFARRYSWQLPYPLDAEAMRRASRALIGTHDFRSFETGSADRDGSVRTVFAIDVNRPVADRPCELHVEVEGDGFLYKMVRTIAGTLVRIGRGVKPVHWAADVLASQNRAAAGVTAPARGLFLLWVAYDSCAPPRAEAPIGIVPGSPLE
jgi:tRNA pseudouridine38-40 synthase